MPAVRLCQDVLCIYSVICMNNFQYYISSVIAIANLIHNLCNIYSYECAYERNSNLSDSSVLISLINCIKDNSFYGFVIKLFIFTFSTHCHTVVFTFKMFIFIFNLKTIIHLVFTCRLSTDSSFSAWNDVVAAILKLWRQIETQDCQSMHNPAKFHPDPFWWNFILYWRGHHNKKNKNKISSKVRSVPDLKWS